jgi:hypothetical protein
MYMPPAEILPICYPSKKRSAYRGKYPFIPQQALPTCSPLKGQYFSPKTNTQKNMKHTTRTLHAAALVCGMAITTMFASCGGETKEEPKAETPVASGSGSYSFDQQVFCLNILSNISAHYNGNPNIKDSTKAAVARTLGNSTVQSLIGNWQLIWGPYVYAGKNDTAKNTMYIVQKQNTDTFVVAVAGTDPSSKFDWYYEDADIVLVPWNKNIPNSGSTSGATATGLGVLQLLGDSTAQQVLAARVSAMKNAQIWVTGHSLGGALSPAFALYLSDNMNTVWVPGANATIHCLAVAGATPGDQTFSNYYNQQMGATTRRVWNNRDVVPHGFAEYMLNEVKTLYPADSVGAMPDSISKQLWKLKAAVFLQNYTQLYPSVNDSFTSCIYTADSLKSHGKGYWSDTSYLDQAMFQHIPSYAVYFNILGFQQAVQAANNLPYPFFSQGAIQVPVY